MYVVVWLIRKMQRLLSRGIWTGGQYRAAEWVRAGRGNPERVTMWRQL